MQAATVYASSLPGSPVLAPADVHRMFQSPTVCAPGAPPSPGASPAAVLAHASRRHLSRNRFHAELSQCLFDFVIQLLPTPEELSIKEDVRKLLERLIRTIEPQSRLLSFGSTANGFALRNSDMDLCCMLDSEERLNAADLVTMLGDLLERETKFHVKPLPHARIPIVKLSLDPSPGLPQGIACDIGFENRLALENTRLLMCYAMIDPARVRTMVLFLKVWSKRRKINSPYRGTLSSYGYVLLVLYFLTHVKNPPVLPNLQQIPPLRTMSPEDMNLNGNNIWFFDDIEVLRQRWQSSNTETVSELLADFFRYYARDFNYNGAVISLRAGAMRKEAKGWQSTAPRGKYEDPRERNRFCIEDPFETDFNVARCVSKDGLYTIRGEFMRAYRIFQARPDRAIVALSQLCEERQEEELPPLGGVSYIPARLTPLPPQTPYTVGSSSLRPQVVPAPIAEEPASKPDDADGRSTPLAAPVAAPHAPVLEHMAPKRGKWTSPPPPDAPLADLASFEDRLGYGLELATAPTDARQRAHTENSSASNSEIFTDDGKISDVADLDDVRSVRSFSEESSTPNWSPRPSSVAYSYSHETDVESKRTSLSPLVSALRPRPGNATRGNLQPRGRRAGKAPEDPGDSPTPTHASYGVLDAWAAGPSRRSASGPARPMNTRYSMPPTPVEGFMPMHPLAMQRPPFIRPTAAAPASTVFYETSAGKEQRARADPGALAPGGAGPSTAAYAAQPYVAMLAPYVHPMYPHYLMDPRMFAHPTAASPTMSPLDPVSPTAFTRWATPSRDQLNALAGESLSRTRNREPKTPTPTASTHNSGSAPRRRGSHAHTHSTATVVPADSGSRAEGSSRSGGKARSRSRSRTSTAGTSPASTPVAEVPPSLRTTSRSATKSRSSGVEPKAKDDVPQDAPAEDSTHSAPGKLATLDTSARWSPAPRRSKSPHSPGTDSPAPSSPSSSFVTSPSTSPPSPANVKDVAVTDPVLVLDVVVEQNLSPEQETARVKSPASGLHPEAITEVPAAETTTIGDTSVQEPTELPAQER